MCVRERERERERVRERVRARVRVRVRVRVCVRIRVRVRVGARARSRVRPCEHSAELSVISNHSLPPARTWILPQRFEDIDARVGARS